MLPVYFSSTHKEATVLACISLSSQSWHLTVGLMKTSCHPLSLKTIPYRAVQPLAGNVAAIFGVRTPSPHPHPPNPHKKTATLPYPACVLPLSTTLPVALAL